MTHDQALASQLRELATYLSNQNAKECLEEAATRLREQSAELGRLREAILRDAALAVCGYCDGHFPEYERQAEGPNSASNYVHVRKDRAGWRAQLCKASGIYHLLRAALSGEGEGDG